MTEPIKVTIDGVEKEVFLKDDFIAAQSKLDATQRELEDTRMEVLTPQYEAFLKSQESGNETEAKKEVKKEVTDDEFKGMTSKQIYDKALADAEKKIDEKLSKRENETKAEQDARSKREVIAFKEKTPDYDLYRPVMYGMSLDPKNSDLNINQLYEKAKEHVKSIQTGSTDDQKNKSRKSSSEKPGNDNTAFDKLKKTSNEQIGRDALDEIKQSLGDFPSA